MGALLTAEVVLASPFPFQLNGWYSHAKPHFVGYEAQQSLRALKEETGFA